MSFKKISTWSVGLVRHATLIIKNKDVTFLVDPMLSPKGAMDPVGNSGNDIRIPMVDLPFDVKDILEDVDAVFVTHTHRDHWDAVAHEQINKSIAIFCQPVDLDKIRSQGFTNVTAIEDKAQFKGITVHRTGGQHGTGEIGQKMGTVSGFVFERGANKLYVAGDTIWCDDVKRAITTHKPQVVVVNAGGAQFLAGDPITMNAADVMTTSKAVGSSKVIAVHMDTVNHCKVTRNILQSFVAENKLTNVLIPADGQTLAV